MNTNQEQTISSLEIAQVTGKLHKNVMRDIKTTLEEAEIGGLSFERTYTDSQGKQRPCYHLPRFECDLVVSGYSVPYRASIIKKWYELEAQIAQPQQPVLPQTYKEALIALVDAEEEREQLTISLAVSDTKVKHLEYVQDKILPDAILANTLLAKNIDTTIKGLSKTLSENYGKYIGPVKLNKYLRDEGYLITSGTYKNYPIQRFVNQGLFVYKYNTGTQVAFITRKGLQKLIPLILEHFDRTDTLVAQLTQVA